MTGLTTICVSDPLKLLIQYQGYSGFEIQTWFEQMGIYVELATTSKFYLYCRYGMRTISIHLKHY